MIDYLLVKTYENHAWGNNYSTLCIRSNGYVYKTNNKVEIFESLLSSTPVCKIKLDKMKNIEKNIIGFIDDLNLNFNFNFNQNRGGFDIGTIKYYLCMKKNNGYYSNIFLGESGDKNMNREYTNFIIKEINNIENAVENYVAKKIDLCIFSQQ